MDGEGLVLGSWTRLDGGLKLGCCEDALVGMGLVI